MADGVVDDAGAGDADVDDCFGLADPVECARHKRIVFDGVGEADELGAGQTIPLACALRCVFQNVADVSDGIHVDSGARRRDVDR